MSKSCLENSSEEVSHNDEQDVEGCPHYTSNTTTLRARIQERQRDKRELWVTWLERACFWPPSSAKTETTEVVENDWLAETRREGDETVSCFGRGVERK